MKLYRIEILFFAIILLVFNSSIVISQVKKQTWIKGKVLDVKSKKPIENVNVSILGTLKGAATDKDGNFIIKNVPSSKFNIVVSYVGYKTQKHSVNILKGTIFKRNYYLEKKVFELNEVIVDEESNRLWRENYKIFKEQFIGILNNSNFTEILDPYIIKFSTTGDGWLSAETNEPIIIRNNALGYNIKYYIDSFQYYSPTVKYSGQPFFDELSNEDEISYNKIKKQRIETYCGSLRHFLRAAIKQYIQDSIKMIVKNNLDEQDSLKTTFLGEQGFKVYTQRELKNNSGVPHIIYPIDMNLVFSPGPDDSHVYLKFPNYIRVTYNREKEEEVFLERIGKENERMRPKVQTSLISLSSDSLLVDSTGYYFDNYNLHTFGYWSFDRVSSMLPYEYFLPDSVLKKYNSDTE